MKDKGAKGGQPVATQRRQESERPPFAERRFGDEALASGAAAMGARHVGLRPGLVDKEEPPRIDRRLTRLQPLTPPGDVRPVLFGGARLFLNDRPAELRQPVVRVDDLVETGLEQIVLPAVPPLPGPHRIILRQADGETESRPNAPINLQEIKPTDVAFLQTQRLPDPRKRLKTQAKPDSSRTTSSFLILAIWLEMPDPPARLTPADPGDLTAALAFALRFDGRRRKNDAAEFIADLVAKRLVMHLERAGFVVMKRPPAIGGAALGRGFEG